MLLVSKLAYKLGLIGPHLRILVLCKENMCRSPLVAALIIDELKRYGVDHLVSVKSAGVAVSMIGSKPDARIYQLSKAHGFALTASRSKQVSTDDFSSYDLVLAVDKQVQDQVSSRYRFQIPLFLDCLGSKDQEVPDPYYGNTAGFEHVYQLSKKGAEVVAQLLLPQLKPS